MEDVVELKRPVNDTGFEAGVVFKLIGRVGCVGGVVLGRGIGISAHAVEGEGANVERLGFIEVHVLDEAVGIKEIVARPTLG